MNALYQSAFLKALGWSLLDSFWQVGILWLLYVVLTANGKKFKPGQRHSLALLSLTGAAIWFLVTLITHFYNLMDGAALVIQSTPETSVSMTSFFSYLEPVLPIFSLAYLIGLVYLFIRLYRQYYFTQRLFSTGLHKADPELRVFLRRVAAQMGIKKNVSIWLSELVDTPLTIGFWKPVVLLPMAVINHLSIQQAEAIILHELNHIRRNDYFVNLLIACMDIILFFNPFVRILTHIIKNERENCCDDMVLQFRYDAGQYANALLLLEKNRVVAPTLTLNATGRSRKLLLQRVERILNKQSAGAIINHKLTAYLVSAFLIAVIGFYNPGQVIVKTIDTVRSAPAANDTEIITFTNVPDQVPEKTIAPVKKITQHQSASISQSPEPNLDDLDEEIIDQIARAVPVTNENDETLTSLLSYAGTAEIREFSIPENNVQFQSRAYDIEVHPYIPSTSFSYHIVEDTLMPKKYIPTPSDIKAQEAMTSALKALEEINWQKIEKEMLKEGKKVDIIKLQGELKKALTDVDWKKINQEMESTLIQAENDLLKDHSFLQAELKKSQQERRAKLGEEQRIYKAIIRDRLCDDQHQEPKPAERKKAPKKIVQI